MLTYLSRHHRWLFGLVFCLSWFFAPGMAAQTSILQPLADRPVTGSAVKLKSDFYVPATPETIRWGYLPDNAAKPVVTVRSGATVTFDTVSHEGILEDQGRDPVKYFGGFGVVPDQVLNDAKAIAALIAKLDDDSHDEREAVSKELQKRGIEALPQIRRAAAESKSAEVRQRAQEISQKLKNVNLTADQRRLQAVLCVLELIASTEARRVLEDVASGKMTKVLE